MDIDAIATELLAALDHTQQIAPITQRVPEFSVAAAYEVGDAILRHRRARGERPIGRKLGFTNRAVWLASDGYAPFWAPVYDSTVTFLGTTTGEVAVGDLAQPRLEPEIVLHFRSAPPLTANEAELLSHVDWIAVAYEIVQCHFPAWAFQSADAVADFGLHGALVVGPGRPVTSLSDPAADLRSFTVALARDGTLQARGRGTNVLGSPLLAVVHLLEMLRDQPQFEPIRAGEIVATGTVTPLVAVQAGETWSSQPAGIALDGLRLRIV